MDTVSSETRSRIMSRVGQKNTGAEVALRTALHRMGLRYRLHDRTLPGSPDLVFPRFRTVVFVHGCFWHRHVDCNKATTPKSNLVFWQDKFDRNVARDARVRRELHDQGWQVLVSWECQLQSKVRAVATAATLAAKIRSNEHLKNSRISY